MARFRTTMAKQTLLVAVSYEDQILSGSFEEALIDILHRMDLSILKNKYRNDHGGRPAYNPELLLRIILMSYSRGIYSSRQMARACRENVLFMAIAEGECPDFTTLADFIANLTNEIHSIFEKVVLICSESGLIGGETFAMDGCKIRSNASKEWSGTIKELTRKKEKIRLVVDDLIMKHQNADSRDDKKVIQKRIKRNSRIIEKISSYLETTEPQRGRQGREKKGNITDPESASMFSSKGFIQGYNGVSLVDSKYQIVVATEAFGMNQEHPALIPVLSRAEMISGKDESVIKKGARFLADTGYFSEENLKYLSEGGYDDYIPDGNFRRRDKRFKDRMPEVKPKTNFIKSDFRFIENENFYICPAGKKLLQKGKLANYRGGKAKIYHSSQADCTACKIRDKCISPSAKRKMLWLPLHGKKNYSELMRTKIDSPEGRKVYTERMHIVEPVFGNIRFHKRLDYFTLRTKRKVNVQWTLFNMVHNIEKYARYAN